MEMPSWAISSVSIAASVSDREQELAWPTLPCAGRGVVLPAFEGVYVRTDDEFEVVPAQP